MTQKLKDWISKLNPKEEKRHHHQWWMVPRGDGQGQWWWGYQKVRLVVLPESEKQAFLAKFDRLQENNE